MPLLVFGEPILVPIEDPVPRKKRAGATTNSIALVACHDGQGVVLALDGAAIEGFVDESSSRRLDDVGLDDAPDGLSIWEGHAWGPSDPTPFSDEGAELVGKFRDLTDAEWTLLRETGVPWEYES